jgi:hypothetical protein
MNKKVVALIVVALIVSSAYGAYIYFTPNKLAKVTYLINNNYSQGTPNVLMTFGDDYINAWYKAAKAGQAAFILSGKTYHTLGGTAV